MRRQTLLILLFTLFGACAAAQQDNRTAVNCTQFMAWTAGGMSSQRLDRLAHQWGIAFTPDAATSQSLLLVGAEPSLIQGLRSIHCCGGFETRHSAPRKLGSESTLLNPART